MDDDEPDEEAASTNEEEKKEAERKRLEQLREKALFYLTTFFILLGIVSLFVFLFLVPFLIEPAISTILMEFDETPTTCVTAMSEMREGASNCSQPGGWASCREGCTREIYECAQIFVNYTVRGDRARELDARHRRSPHRRQLLVRGYRPVSPGARPEPDAWAYSYARVYPNVKGCGYPPHLNCTVFHDRYFDVGASYPCYYSRVEPWVVITELDLAKSTRQLVYSMVFPIPCFVVSVAYVALAYFCVYAGRNSKPKTKRRVVRRMVGGGSGGGGGGGGQPGGSGYRAAACAKAAAVTTGSEVTPLTTNDDTGADAPPPRSDDDDDDHCDGGTGTPDSQLLYRDDDDDDDASGTCYGDQLRSTLAVDDSSADYVNTLRLSEQTLRQSDSNGPSRDEWSEDDDRDADSLDRSVRSVSVAAPFAANPTGYGRYSNFGIYRPSPCAGVFVPSR